MSKLLFILTFFFFFSLGVVLFSSVSFGASSTKLFLSPSLATKSAGSSFGVEVRINTGGEKINSAALFLTFSQDLLEATLSTENSWASVFSQKEVDNKSGSVKLNGGSSAPTEGENLLLGTINFKAKKAGVAKVNFTEQSVVYKGTTSVLVSSAGGVYTIQPTTLEGPVLPKAGIIEQSLYLILLAFGSIALGFVLNRKLS